MRLALVLSTLALSAAAPASASPEGPTGGAGVPAGSTGGVAAPSETDYRDAVKDGALPAGRPEAGDNAERSVASPRHGPPHRDGAATRAHAAQEGQPDVPPTDEERDEGDADVQVPIDEGDAEPGATQHAPPGPQFGGLAPTGLAVAGFAALGAAAAAAGLGLRRLAR